MNVSYVYNRWEVITLTYILLTVRFIIGTTESHRVIKSQRWPFNTCIGALITRRVCRFITPISQRRVPATTTTDKSQSTGDCRTWVAGLIPLCLIHRVLQIGRRFFSNFQWQSFIAVLFLRFEFIKRINDFGLEK